MTPKPPPDPIATSMTTLDGIDRNPCPPWIGISVRLRSELLSLIVGIRMPRREEHDSTGHLRWSSRRNDLAHHADRGHGAKLHLVRPHVAFYCAVLASPVVAISLGYLPIALLRRKSAGRAPSAGSPVELEGAR